LIRSGWTDEGDQDDRVSVGFQIRTLIRETHRHVALTPDVGLGQTLFELTRNTEITQFDLTLLVGEQVGRLDIW
jgi:hypothetical protein